MRNWVLDRKVLEKASRALMDSSFDYSTIKPAGFLVKMGKRRMAELVVVNAKGEELGRFPNGPFRLCKGDTLSIYPDDNWQELNLIPYDAY